MSAVECTWNRFHVGAPVKTFRVLCILYVGESDLLILCLCLLDGASARAGVRNGDRIYKVSITAEAVVASACLCVELSFLCPLVCLQVNGASVANYDHTEVVNLIKCKCRLIYLHGTYIVLICK